MKAPNRLTDTLVQPDFFAVEGQKLWTIAYHNAALALGMLNVPRGSVAEDAWV